jgi:hypothetical protein
VHFGRDNVCNAAPDKDFGGSAGGWAVFSDDATGSYLY